MLTQEQIKEAVAQMKVHCDIAYNDNYRALSARQTLRELGYDSEDLEQVLQFIYDAGFTYCFDSYFLSGNGIDNNKEYPDPDVCYWGPDQLKSRLEAYVR